MEKESMKIHSIYTKDDLLIHYLHENDVFLWENATRFARTCPIETFDTVIDIGAHVGSLSLFMAKLGVDRILAIEPIKENIEMLRSNIEANQLEDRITILPIAVDSTSGDIFLARETFDTSGQYSKYNSSGIVREKCESKSFTDILKSFSHVDYLKIDIEGAEFEILPPLPEIATLLERVRFLDLDIHDPTNPDYFRLEWPFEFKYYSNRETATRELIEFLMNCGFSEKSMEEYLSDFPPGIRSKRC